MNIMGIAAAVAVVMALWAIACRRIHLDLVDSINKESGKLIIPRSQTVRFFICGCAAILAIALVAVVAK